MSEVRFAPGVTIFCGNLSQDRDAQNRLGQLLIQLGVLFLGRAKLLRLRHFQATKLRVAFVEHRPAYTVTASNSRCCSARFLFVQNPDHLLIAEPAALHSSVPLRNRRY
ncbi:MAG: hypothetical protein INF97_11915 [Roseomonas sp.]|nr:hypothetical protein [Roseomonas sp.]